MATFYRCDRCKTETTSRLDIGTVTYPRRKHYGGFENSGGEEDLVQKDLCEGCVIAFERFLENKP